MGEAKGLVEGNGSNPAAGILSYCEHCSFFKGKILNHSSEVAPLFQIEITPTFINAII